MSKPYRRRKKLINPRFQLKLAFAGLAIGLISVMVLMIVLNEAIMELMDKGWIDPISVQSGWIGLIGGKMLLAAALLVPLTLALGVLFTHRIAGPMYRFHKFLTAVRDGEKPGRCTIRKGDEFQEFCDLLNDVTLPLRVDEPVRDASPIDEDEQPVEEEEPEPARQPERLAG